MRNLFYYALALLIFASCSNTNQGELVGVRKKSKPFYQPDPYGMVFIPQGSYTMGVGGEDITYGQLSEPKTISVSAFFMDETEITNNEYREFVYWVRDSIARTILGEVLPDEYLITENEKTGEVYDPPYLNWKTKIEWTSENQDVRDALENGL
ncbi:MAG: formylglycine-generating enzyme family protein, partial [Bacteroidales bacterium]